jgi:hypothetical protein
MQLSMQSWGGCREVAAATTRSRVSPRRGWEPPRDSAT